MYKNYLRLSNFLAENYFLFSINLFIYRNPKFCKFQFEKHDPKIVTRSTWKITKTIFPNLYPYEKNISHSYIDGTNNLRHSKKFTQFLKYSKKSFDKTTQFKKKNTPKTPIFQKTTTLWTPWRTSLVYHPKSTSRGRIPIILHQHHHLPPSTFHLTPSPSQDSIYI